MQEKYINKKIIISGKVSMIREGEYMYSVVFNNRVECYIPKDGEPEQKKALAALKNQNAKISGYCIGVRGLDRIVVLGASLE